MLSSSFGKCPVVWSTWFWVKKGSALIDSQPCRHNRLYMYVRKGSWWFILGIFSTVELRLVKCAETCSLLIALKVCCITNARLMAFTLLRFQCYIKLFTSISAAHSGDSDLPTTHSVWLFAKCCLQSMGQLTNKRASSLVWPAPFHLEGGKTAWGLCCTLGESAE